MVNREKKEIRSVEVDDIVKYPQKESDGGQLVFQRLQVTYIDGTHDFRYAFTWLDSRGHITPNRGRTLIPRIEMIYNLLEQAEEKEWFKTGHQNFQKE